MNNKWYVLEACRGFSGKGCPNCVAPHKDLPDRYDRVIEELSRQKLDENRNEQLVRPHKKMKISLSGCPNGCSRPQIADLGVVGVLRPDIGAGCSGCGICAAVCREGAVQVIGKTAVIDRGKCLDCGECCLACPEGSLVEIMNGYRLLVGGKLGRHPRLARDLGMICTRRQAEDVLQKILELHKMSVDQGIRLSSLIENFSIQEFSWHDV
ncbi:hypothetical protein [Desulfonatronovibrio hydrogenovorans]|uniref:hypothetical protein n=1 Tax=Desulfonatronovibrio hydrogenovorans TaxID=53245 RepID=UPI00069123BF|nr:hypothetical protein [Desulfonatronovibrio hydrogenovorans]